MTLIRSGVLCCFALLATTSMATEAPAKLVNPEALPANKKIVLSNFVIEFQDQYIKTKRGFQIMGLGSMNTSTATNSVSLPDAQVLQALTDFAYGRVQEKLKEQGYEVVLPSQLPNGATESNAKLRELAPVKSGMAIENRDGSSVLYTPSDLTSVIPYNGGCDHYTPLMDHKGLLDRMAATKQQIANTVAANGQPGWERKLAKAAGAPLLKVWVTVGFGDVEANGAASFISQRQKSYLDGTEKTTVTNAANSQATSGMYLKPEVTRLSITNPVDSDHEWSCGIAMFGANKPPADGEALIMLAEKLRDDGSEVKSLSTSAGDITVTDRSLGANTALRSIKEGQAAVRGGGNGQNVQLENRGTSTSGRVDVNNGGAGTQLNTRSNYATTIRADYYATSVLKMVEDMSNTLIGRLK